MGRTRQRPPTADELVDTSRQNIDYHREKGIIVDKLGGQCAECGTLDYLEIHHIKGVEKSYRSGAERIRDWKIQIKKNNLLLLCVDCHGDITHKRPTMNMSKRVGQEKMR